MNSNYAELICAHTYQLGTGMPLINAQTTDNAAQGRFDEKSKIYSEFEKTPRNSGNFWNCKHLKRLENNQ